MTINYTSLTVLKKVSILLLFLISCHSSNDGGKDHLTTYDLKELPRISEVKLTDLGFVDIKYIPLETNEQSVICDLNGLFTLNSIIASNEFFLVKCGNNKIFKFQKDGSFETLIGTVGRGPNEFTVVHDVEIDKKTNNIYILARWQKKIFVYSEHGELIRTIQIPISANKLSFCNDGILCYSENHMANIENSYDLIDTSGRILRSYPNKYPFKVNDAYHESGENLFYSFGNKLYIKEVYSDTIYLYEKKEFLPHLVIQVGDRLLTPEARSSFDGLYLGEHYIKPQKLFEFGDYIYYDFCYSVKIPNDVLVYRFIGSKEDNSSVFINYDEGILNDLDGGLNILPENYLNDNTIVAVIDVMKLKNHIESESFIKSKPKYPDKKNELEKIAKNLKETDNPILVLISLKKL